MGVFIGILGVGLLPLTLGLEESVGLDSLFRLRGSRKVPPAVAIVTLDRLSADALGVPTDPDEWPRSLHARLIDVLVERGATVIAFDIIFDSPSVAEDDAIFAGAIRRAGNVVLGQGLTTSTLPLSDQQGSFRGQVNIEKLISPVSPLDRSALAMAPFPLPKIPVQVSQYWRIKPEAGDVATLPVVAFQIWSLTVWERLHQLMGAAGFTQIETLPGSKAAILGQGNLQGLIQTLREVFEKNREKIANLLNMLDTSGDGSHDAQDSKILKSLVHLHTGKKTSHLNYYGPPGTIQTIGYGDLLASDDNSADGPPLPDFNGGAIFVGLSERMRPDQKDGFHTVFSLPNGVDISGVEIAATAFANLVEDSSLRPFDPTIHFIFVFLWGGLLGFSCLLLPPIFAALGAVGLGSIYTLTAYYQFKASGLWFPLVLPLLFQVPLAFFGALLWQYAETNRERRNIRKAAGYYLPNAVVDRLTRSVDNIQAETQTVYGTCLLTDAERYTALSEQLTPGALSRFMNAYYAAIFQPVKEQGGVVSDVVGDSMLALWTTPSPDAGLRQKACLAALGISRAVHRFNQTSGFSPLPTRIGLHSGSMILGNIGAGDHYEYRPVGEVVNTASRIEGLNKYLQTRILVSKEVVDQLDGLFTRELGDFLFAGKSNPVRIHELVDLSNGADPARRACSAIFSRALEAFRSRRWQEAIGIFRQALEHVPEDGPSAFYLKLCEQYNIRPPADGWDGCVSMERK